MFIALLFQITSSIFATGIQHSKAYHSAKSTCLHDVDIHLALGTLLRQLGGAKMTTRYSSPSILRSCVTKQVLASSSRSDASDCTTLSDIEFNFFRSVAICGTTHMSKLRVAMTLAFDEAGNRHVDALRHTQKSISISCKSRSHFCCLLSSKPAKKSCYKFWCREHYLRYLVCRRIIGKKQKH